MRKRIKELDIIIRNYQEEIKNMKSKIKEMSEDNKSLFSEKTIEEWRYSLIKMMRGQNMAEQERRVLKDGINYKLELRDKTLGNSFIELQTIINLHTEEIKKLKRDVQKLKKVI